MYELFGTQGPLWIGAALMVLLVLVFNSRIRAGAKWLLRGVVGAVLVLVLNVVLAPMGLAVGLNVLTGLILVFLGVPGIIMLYGAQLFL